MVCDKIRRFIAVRSILNRNYKYEFRHGRCRLKYARNPDMTQPGAKKVISLIKMYFSEVSIFVVANNGRVRVVISYTTVLR